MGRSWCGWRLRLLVGPLLRDPQRHHAHASSGRLDSPDDEHGWGAPDDLAALLVRRKPGAVLLCASLALHPSDGDRLHGAAAKGEPLRRVQQLELSCVVGAVRRAAHLDRPIAAWLVRAAIVIVVIGLMNLYWFWYARRYLADYVAPSTPLAGKSR